MLFAKAAVKRTASFVNTGKNSDTVESAKKIIRIVLTISATTVPANTVKQIPKTHGFTVKTKLSVSDGRIKGKNCTNTDIPNDTADSHGKK